ncbi:MAG: hypothetical protein DME22_24760 [Verrucomicrobia bacterium]|nr:MAG: hypothetical protein DME22_24760 [Verrucomicrobiota bacterium]
MNDSRQLLRILQVNSLFSGGGTDNQTMDLAVGLQELGQSVTLAVGAGSRWEPLAKQLNGVEVETFPPKTALKSAMIHRLAGIVRTKNVQILHAHQGRDYWPGILAAKAACQGTRVVVTRHLMTRPRRLSRWLLLHMADVVAVSHAVETVLQRELHGPKHRLHQVYGGIDPDKFQAERTVAGKSLRQHLGWTEEDVAFGVVGVFNLPRGKGQLEFLEAAAQLHHRCPRARFALIGSGTMEEMLQERIGALGLASVTTMIAFTDDIAPVMNALDVVVHPAVGTEALGLVIWEALASAKPVIASRLNGIPEAFVEGEHGLLVPPADVPALTEAMWTLLQRPKLRLQFGCAGREHVCRHFSRAVQAARMMELYLKLYAPR